jgi:hypothetical protein
VIDHQFDRLERVDAVRIAAEALDAVAHRREIHDRGDAGEVLEQHARRCERDLALGAALQIPLRERLDVRRLDEAAIFIENGIRATCGNPAFSRAGKLNI